MLIEGERDLDTDDALRALLQDFTPILVNLRVEYMDRGDVLDAYSFVSDNAVLFDTSEGRMDEESQIGSGFRLK